LSHKPQFLIYQKLEKV